MPPQKLSCLPANEMNENDTLCVTLAISRPPRDALNEMQFFTLPGIEFRLERSMVEKAVVVV